MRYYIISTGYEGNYEYRLNIHYTKFVKRYKKIPSLVSIDNFVRPEHKKIVEYIKEYIRDTTRLDKNAPVFAKEFSAEIISVLNDKNLSNKTKSIIRKALLLEEIETIIDQARKLDYCHIWKDDNSGEISQHMLNNKDEIIIISLEAESG